MGFADSYNKICTGGGGETEGTALIQSSELFESGKNATVTAVTFVVTTFLPTTKCFHGYARRLAARGLLQSHPSYVDM